MAVAEDSKLQENRPTGVGPGDRLQSARIQLGLSIEEVATRMHLSLSLIHI